LKDSYDQSCWALEKFQENANVPVVKNTNGTSWVIKNLLA